ncbi:hypothetical protein [Streptomyces diastaticus]
MSLGRALVPDVLCEPTRQFLVTGLQREEFGGIRAPSCTAPRREGGEVLL